MSGNKEKMVDKSLSTQKMVDKINFSQEKVNHA